MLKEIKEWFYEHIPYILAIFITLVITISVYGQANKDIAKAREERNKINIIESRLIKQENSMHYVQAELDNLKEVLYR